MDDVGENNERSGDAPEEVGTDGSDFELDLETGEVWREGRTVDLPPQPTRLLLLLARRPGRLVTREQIRQEIWGDAIVEIDTAINNAIREIRDALGDDASEPRYIETVPRRGYRLIAEPLRRSDPRRRVEDQATGDAESGEEQPPGEPSGALDPVDDLTRPPEDERDRGWLWPAAGVVILVVLMFLLPQFLASGAPTVTVFPARAGTAGSLPDRVAGPLTQSLEEGLIGLEEEGVRFLPWRGAMEYDRAIGQLFQDGEAVEVDLMVDSNVSVEVASPPDTVSTLRIGVGLYSVETGTQLWQRAFFHPVKDPEGAISEVRERVVREVERILLGG